MKRVLIYKISMIIVFALCSCNLNTVHSNEKSDLQNAEKIVENLYDYLEEDLFLETHKLFSDKFFNVTPPDSLNSMFLRIKSLGEYENKSLQDWRTLRVSGATPKAEYMLHYKVEYSLYSAQEIIRMEKEEDKIMIVSYEVYSEGF